MAVSQEPCRSKVAQETQKAVEHEKAPVPNAECMASAGQAWRTARRRSRYPAAARSVASLLFVTALHAGLIAALILHYPQPPHASRLPQPMMVALVAPPEPDRPAVATPRPAQETPPAPQPTPPKPLPKKAVQPVKKPVPRPQPSRVPAQAKRSVPPQSLAAPAQHSVQGPPTEAPPEPVPPRFSADYLRNPAPQYPPISRRLGERGKVLLRVLVNSEGRPETVEIQQSCGHERLDHAAREAVKQWQFIPARLGEQSVRAWVVVPIVFTLKG